MIVWVSEREEGAEETAAGISLEVRVSWKPPTRTLLSTRLSLLGSPINRFEDTGRHFLPVFRGDGGRHEHTRFSSFRSTECLGVSSDSAGPSASISKLGDVYISLDKDGASLDRETERELITTVLVRESFSRSFSALSPLFRARMEPTALVCAYLRLGICLC